MQPHVYSDLEKSDVIARQTKALAFLKELELTPAANMQKVNLGVEGKDIFADLVQPYLQDTKYNKPIVNTSEPETPKITDVEVGIPSTNSEVNPAIDPTNPQPQG